MSVGRESSSLSLSCSRRSRDSLKIGWKRTNNNQKNISSKIDCCASLDFIKILLKSKIKTLDSSRRWFESSKSSSRLREYFKTSSGTASKLQWRRSKCSTCFDMHLNMAGGMPRCYLILKLEYSVMQLYNAWHETTDSTDLDLEDKCKIGRFWKIEHQDTGIGRYWNTGTEPIPKVPARIFQANKFLEGSGSTGRVRIQKQGPGTGSTEVSRSGSKA